MKTIEALKAYLIDTLPQANIYLFGSRAKESATIKQRGAMAIAPYTEKNPMTTKKLFTIHYSLFTTFETGSLK